MKNFLRNNLTVFLFFISSLTVLLIAIYTSIMISTISVFLKENIEEHLLAESRAAAHVATVDELAALVSPADIDTPLFSDLRNRMIDFADESHILFVYYMRKVTDDEVQFIIDNDTTEDSVNLATPTLPIEDSPRRAFEGTATTSGLENYSVGYAGLLSSFAPVFDSSGQVVAVVGVDVSDEQVLSARNQIRLYIILLILSTTLLIGTGFFSLFLYRKKESALTKQLEQQEIMANISQSFISEESMSTLIEDSLRQMGKALEATRILIAVAEKDSNNSRPLYFWFSSNEFRPTPTKTGFNELITSTFPKTLSAQKNVPTIYCNNIQVDNDKKYKILEITGLKSFIWAPLYIHGEFWGLLSIEECVSERVWSESDKRLVSMVSSTIAGAVARDLMEQERTAALNQAKNASQAKSDFLANMSHEMRTPMNAIIGMTMIAKTADIERKDYCLSKIDDASTHLLGVINDILDMSKIEANKLELSFESFSFEKMLQKVVNVINFRVEERQQNLIVYIDKEIPPFLIGDDQRLAQVITNLLSNAVKFTPEQGNIRLNTHLLHHGEDGLCTVQIEVCDTGIGLSKEQQSRLFSSFEQADSSTSRKFGGTGLGLAISKRIVEMMNGQIWVESELDKGSTFAFTIQAKRDPKEEKHDDSLLLGINWNNVRVLMVDDEREVREYFKEIAQQFGIACDTASGGAEACTLIKQNGSYDIYFLDWKMPGMDGIELSRQIKGHGTDKSVVIMISATEWSVIAENAKEAGVDKFLPKPLFPSAITDCINECLGTSSVLALEPQPGEVDCFSEYRVLLAEDVEINQEIVLALLEPTQLTIDCVDNGAEALERFHLEPEKYDAILMDVQMPEMDGYEATRQIRKLDIPRATTIPIIAMTANVFREDIERCRASGMDDHLGKPLDIEDVLAKLRKYLLKEIR
ncbi:response regulator [Lachnospiraceae bacterium ZAX-1]